MEFPAGGVLRRQRIAVLQGAERHFIPARGAHTQLGLQGLHGLRAREMQPRIKLFGLLQLAARNA